MDPAKITNFVAMSRDATDQALDRVTGRAPQRLQPLIRELAKALQHERHFTGQAQDRALERADHAERLLEIKKRTERDATRDDRKHARDHRKFAIGRSAVWRPPARRHRGPALTIPGL
jgi:hypothetical protein